MKQTRTTIIALASLALLSACGFAPEEKFAEAKASFAANDYAGAKVYLVSALKEAPGDEEMLLLLAETQIAMGDGEGALASLVRLHKSSKLSTRNRSRGSRAAQIFTNTTYASMAVTIE